MGCGASKQQDKNITSSNIIKVRQSEEEEFQQIIELPLRSREEDSDLFSLVELTVSCASLSSDQLNPPCTMVVFYAEEETGLITEKSRTEIQNNSHSPAFMTSFKVSYCFEKQLKFRFDVFDMKEPNNSNLTRQTFLGSLKCNIHEIVCSPTRSITKPIENTQTKRKNGTITVSSEEMSDLNHHVKMHWEIINKNLKGPMFLKFLRTSNAKNIPIFETALANSSPYRWEQIDIPVNKLCRGEESRKIKLEAYRVDKKKHELIGSCNFTLADIKETTNFQAILTHENRNIANICLNGFEYEERTSFLDYIFGGCEISLIVGIDFTKSNGLPAAPNSLHFLKNEAPNEYIQALTAVGEILQYYDSDKRIPVYGFGAKLPPNFSVTSHCFALNGNFFDPEVNGIPEVLDVYKSAINTVHFYGPTIFNELIQTAVQYASSVEVSQKRQQYFILLILTDGIINDIDHTIDEIVTAGEYPLSIIIVGVGNEDFSLMEQLDADIQPLYSKRLKKTMERDIVQFVPFSNFKSNPSDLAKEVLYEVPKQLITYMNKHNITPHKDKRINDENIYRTNTTSQKMIPNPHNTHPSSLLLTNMKLEFIKKIEELGYDQEKIAEVIEEGVCCMDTNIVVELMELKSSMSVRKSVLRKTATKTLSVPPSKVRFGENDNKYYIIDKEVN